LHGIAGFADLLLETALSEKQRRWLFSIYHSTERLNEVVNDVLELSKLEAGAVQLRKIPFSPGSVAQDVQESLALRAQNKGIDLLLELQQNVPEAVLGDPTRLFQILINLVGNAVKFTEKGAVRILVDADLPHAEEQQVYLRFRVIDSGIGIPAEKIKAVFGSFQQAGEDTVARFGGTGLGLTVTQELVQLYGGEIHVESTLLVGTTFTVTLPFPLTDAAKLSIKTEEPIEMYSTQKLRILLVDDNELNREIAQEAILRHFENAEIIEATNGKEAISTLETRPFDLVLMDMQMPTLSGTEATRLIRASDSIPDPELPIIALTAATTQEDIEKALTSGMNKHLRKPFKPYQLAAVMGEALGLGSGEKAISPSFGAATEPTDHFLDLSFLRDFTEGDEEQMRYFIQKFLKQYPLEIAQLQRALHDADLNTLGQIAHSFKPQLEFVGLKKTATLVKDLELSAKEGATVEQISGLLEQILIDLQGLESEEQWFGGAVGN
jgi:CheY-like chemotaxis protein